MTAAYCAGLQTHIFQLTCVSFSGQGSCFCFCPCWDSFGLEFYSGFDFGLDCDCCSGYGHDGGGEGIDFG